MELAKKLTIHVRPALTNDFEVVLEADGTNIVDWARPQMMGLDPNDILVEPCSLESNRESHRAMIGRCGCGEIGCGDVEVEIRREGKTVVWRTLDLTREIKFDGDQYDAEVLRAMNDFSWETPDRTAAREIAKSIDRDSLARHGFKFDWASGVSRPGMMTVSLKGAGYHQVLVSLPWDGRDIEKIVRQFQSALTSAPESWPNREEYNRPS